MTHRHPWATTEMLDFRNASIARKTSRLLTSAWRAAIWQDPAPIATTFGITICELDPAYTNHVHSSCGFASKSNIRRDYVACASLRRQYPNADTNGSRTTCLGRSRRVSDLGFHKEKVPRHVDARFETRWGLSLGDAVRLKR